MAFSKHKENVFRLKVDFRGSQPAIAHGQRPRLYDPAVRLAAADKANLAGSRLSAK